MNGRTGFRCRHIRTLYILYILRVNKSSSVEVPCTGRFWLHNATKVRTITWQLKRANDLLNNNNRRRARSLTRTDVWSRRLIATRKLFAGRVGYFDWYVEIPVHNSLHFEAHTLVYDVSLPAEYISNMAVCTIIDRITSLWPSTNMSQANWRHMFSIKIIHSQAYRAKTAKI